MVHIFNCEKEEECSFVVSNQHVFRLSLNYQIFFNIAKFIRSNVVIEFHVRPKSGFIFQEKCCLLYGHDVVPAAVCNGANHPCPVVITVPKNTCNRHHDVTA